MLVCFSCLQFQLPFTYKTRTLSLTRECRDVIQMSCKTLMLLHGKFTQDKMYQILSELVGFCGRYDKKHFGVFFRFTV